MYRVSGTTIELTRGDTLEVGVGITLDGAEYTPAEGDVVWFYLKHPAMDASRRRYMDKEPLIAREVPIDTMMLVLDPADTKRMEFGEYVYDLEITFASGRVSTFINNASFKLLPEVG